MGRALTRIGQWPLRCGAHSGGGGLSTPRPCPIQATTPGAAAPYGTTWVRLCPGSQARAPDTQHHPAQELSQPLVAEHLTAVSRASKAL